MANGDSVFIEAFNTRNVVEFLNLLFPPAWSGVVARIAETGVEFSDTLCHWAPRWSKIPLTVRKGKTDEETAIKSCIFRVHDCFHQLWGLPLPSVRLDESDFYLYKRAQMCGEVAVLTLTEFNFCQHLYDLCPHTRGLIWKRNAIPLLKGPLSNKTTLQIALRLDDILHKKSRPKWLRDSVEATAFADDYVPMLELDRKNIDNNWNIMKKNRWRPVGAPNSRYNQNLDGLELTTWMINDFFHQCETDNVIDEALMKFNRERRATIVIPDGWNGYIK
jgi:hypothetical protein